MIATSGRFAVTAGGERRLRAVLAADRRELLALLSELRSVRPDDVHRARVLARRMRATLRAYAPAFDPARARRARRLLKGYARKLDACREAFVRESLVRDLAAGIDGWSRPESETLVASLERARIVATRAAQRQLRRPGPARALRESLDELVPRKCPGLEQMLERLDGRRRRLLRRMPGGRGEVDWHRLRLAVKSLRYSLAPMEDIAPATGRVLHVRLREAQERLGEQHDAAQALEWLEAEGRLRGGGGRSLRRALRKRERTARRDARRALPEIDDAWRRWRAEAGEVTEALSVRRGRALPAPAPPQARSRRGSRSYVPSR